ncbi:hypothetical protein [Longispora albida]|uniref:hypothetical protein n=1 Tax=Longispora albida TaxID=203523 RepID=UPI000378A69D|nr:hypothetical protein [Longispora albida]
MTRAWIRRAVVTALVLVAAAGCTGGTTAEPAKKASELSGKKLQDLLAIYPCGLYEKDDVLNTIKPSLTKAGWPRMVIEDIRVRMSGHLQRCQWVFAPWDLRKDGSQRLWLSLYNEGEHGGKLMKDCLARPGAAERSKQKVGDESCVDLAGQWRVRVGTEYFSVLVHVPPYMESGDRPLVEGESVTPPSRTTDKAKADIAYYVAADLAKRLG